MIRFGYIVTRFFNMGTLESTSLLMASPPWPTQPCKIAEQELLPHFFLNSTAFTYALTSRPLTVGSSFNERIHERTDIAITLHCTIYLVLRDHQRRRGCIILRTTDGLSREFGDTKTRNLLIRTGLLTG
jgi:hypothetical protein